MAVSATRKVQVQGKTRVLWKGQRLSSSFFIEELLVFLTNQKYSLQMHFRADLRTIEMRYQIVPEVAFEIRELSRLGASIKREFEKAVVIGSVKMI